MGLVIPKGTLHRDRYLAVFFDAGQTLLAPYPSVGARYSEVAARYGLHVPPEEMDLVFKELYRTWAEESPVRALITDQLERTWWKTLVKRVFDRFGKVEEFHSCFDEVFDVFAHAYAWQLFPEVNGVLAECTRRGVCLGIVSNWDSRLLSVCREMNLTHWFHFILYSTQVGIAKPDPDIFKCAVSRSGISATDTLYIGDSWNDDVVGARAAGLDVVWLRREGNLTPVSNVATADSLAAILELC